MKDIMIDPNSGWEYGFPKRIPAAEFNAKGFEGGEWCYANGYPRDREIVWCRFWDAKE